MFILFDYDAVSTSHAHGAFLGFRLRQNDRGRLPGRILLVFEVRVTQGNLLTFGNKYFVVFFGNGEIFVDDFTPLFAPFLRFILELRLHLFDTFLTRSVVFGDLVLRFLDGVNDNSFVGLLFLFFLSLCLLLIIEPLDV